MLLKCIYFAFSAIYRDMNGFSVIKQGLKPSISTQICPLAWWWRWRKDKDNATLHRIFSCPSNLTCKIGRASGNVTVLRHVRPLLHRHGKWSQLCDFLQFNIGLWRVLVTLPGSLPGQNQHLGSNQIFHIFFRDRKKQNTEEGVTIPN